MEIDGVEHFLFDLDQTLWNWDKTILGAEDLIHTIRDAGKKVRFHTDNTLLSREAYAKRLSSMEIPAEKDEILTAGYVAGRYFDRQNIHSVYAIGESGLIEELDEHNINTSRNAENVLIGLDRQFNYRKLERAKKILEDNGNLYVCSTEKTLRKSEGTLPHQLAINNALATFAEPHLLGKPSKEFTNEISTYFGFLPGKAMLVGDRLEDIEMGNRLGMQTALVMSGSTAREELSKAPDIRKPNYGVSNLSKLSRKIR